MLTIASNKDAVRTQVRALRDVQSMSMEEVKCKLSIHRHQSLRSSKADYKNAEYTYYLGWERILAHHEYFSK